MNATLPHGPSAHLINIKWFFVEYREHAFAWARDQRADIYIVRKT